MRRISTTKRRVAGTYFNKLLEGCNEQVPHLVRLLQRVFVLSVSSVVS